MRVTMFALAMGVSAIAGSAAALDQVKLMAPAAPGGGWDQTARAFAQAMTAANQAKSVQVSNVTGAGGTIGLAQFTNQSKGDPNALMVGGLVMIGAIATNKSPVTLEQVTPIARLTGEWEVVVVPAQSPFKSMDDLVAALKKEPGKVAFAGGSAGGTDHILVGLIAQAAGADATKINYVPFSGGGEALAALLGNQVAAGVSSVGEFAAQVKAGKLRALAVSAPKRIEGFDAPTLKEQKIDVELANWRGIFGPPGLSPQQTAEVVKAVEATVKGDAWKATVKQREWDDIYMGGDAFAAYLKDEIKRTDGILRQIGLVK